MRSRSDPLSVAAMAVTVVFVSVTAPLTTSASDAPLAMAFWRNTLGFATLGRSSWCYAVVSSRAWSVVSAASCAGAVASRGLRLRRGHVTVPPFAAFMTRTRLSSVAVSTALVATWPVWEALVAAGQGVLNSRRVCAGLAVSVMRAATVGGLGIRAGSMALLGGLPALAGALAKAGRPS